MWDPNNAFARCDDDVLSWRSFDATLDAEADTDGGIVRDVDADAYAISETASDASDEDELAELIDRSHADVLRLSRYAPRLSQSALNSPHRDSDRENTQAIESKWLAVGLTAADPGESPFSNSAFKEESPAIMLRVERANERSPPPQSTTKELPSTSEMVSIANGTGGTSHWSSEPQMRLPCQDLFESPTRTSEPGCEEVIRRAEQFGFAAPFNDHEPSVHVIHSVGEPRRVDDICHASPQRRQLEITSRERFFPGELVGELEFRNTKHTTSNVYGDDLFLLAQQQQPYSVNHKLDLQLKQSQQRQPMSLSQLLAQSRDGHDPPPPVNRLQNDQMHQRVLHIQQLEAELEGKSVQIQQAHNEEKKWREKSIHLEIQVQHMQSLLIEKEKREEENRQALAQKTAELVSLQTRCLSLQDANETFQEQAKKAVDEKERVQRDYLQVVYDLGKAQKQLNSISKETVTITEKDFLLREIGQLQKDNEELQQKVKDVETKRGPGSSSLSDSQQIISMQKHIQELEDELQKLRVAGSGVATSQVHQPPPAPSIHPTRGNQLYASQSNLLGNSFQSVHTAPSSKDRTATTNLMSAVSSMDFSGRREPSLHQQQPAAAGGDSYSGLKTERPMTLKDIMAGLRSGGGPGTQPSHQGNSMNQALSLESMGFTNPNGSRTQQQCFNLEHFKAETMARRGIGVPGTAADPAVWQHCSSNPIANVFASSSSSRSASFPPVDSSATIAPFATERQSFQLDAVQRRHLEQKLMHLQLEKDQMEAKAVKLEQAGLRTMNARSEKQRLDAKIQALVQDVGKLKLTLR